MVVLEAAERVVKDVEPDAPFVQQVGWVEEVVHEAQLHQQDAVSRVRIADRLGRLQRHLPVHVHRDPQRALAGPGPRHVGQAGREFALVEHKHPRAQGRALQALDGVQREGVESQDQHPPVHRHSRVVNAHGHIHQAAEERDRDRPMLRHLPPVEEPVGGGGGARIGVT